MTRSQRKSELIAMSDDEIIAIWRRHKRVPDGEITHEEFCFRGRRGLVEQEFVSDIVAFEFGEE